MSIASKKWYQVPSPVTWRCLAKICVSLACATGAASQAQAKSFDVNTPSDLVDNLPGDGECSTFVVGTCSLRAAIMEANEFPGQDTVSIPRNITPLLDRDGVGGADVGDLDITDDLVILGDAQGGAELSAKDAVTVLDAVELDGASVHNPERIFHILDGAIVQMSRLRLQNSSADAGGGAILVSSGTLLLDGVLMQSNSSQGDGGAIRVNDVASLYLLETDFYANTLVPGSTGIGAAIANFGYVSITRSSFRGNYQAGDTQIYSGPGSTLEVRNTTLHGVGVAVQSPSGIVATKPIALLLDGVTFGYHSGGTALQMDLRSQGGVPTDFSMRRTVFRLNTLDCLIVDGAELVNTNGRNWFEDASNCTGGANNDVGSLSIDDIGNVLSTRDHLLTHYLALPSGSRLIDEGGDVDGVIACALPVDQRGVGRPNDGNGNGFEACDIGAVEFESIDARFFADGFEFP